MKDAYVIRPRRGHGAAEVSVVKVTDEREREVAVGVLVVEWPSYGDYAQVGTLLDLGLRFRGART